MLEVSLGHFGLTKRVKMVRVHKSFKKGVNLKHQDPKKAKSYISWKLKKLYNSAWLTLFRVWRCQIDYFLDVFVSSNPPNSLNQPKLGQKHLSPSTFKYDPTSKFFWVHIWILGCQLLKPVHQSVPWRQNIRLFLRHDAQVLTNSELYRLFHEILVGKI